MRFSGKVGNDDWKQAVPWRYGFNRRIVEENMEAITIPEPSGLFPDNQIQRSP